MSRILRRPMFRGGRVNSYGTGIASGLADGGRVGFSNGGTSGGEFLRKARVRGPQDLGITSVNPFFNPRMNIGTRRKPKFVDTPLYEDFSEVRQFPLTADAGNVMTDATIVETPTNETEEIREKANVELGLETTNTNPDEFKEKPTETPKINEPDEVEVTMTDLERALGLDKARREYGEDVLAALSKAFLEGKGFEAVGEAAQVKSKVPEIKRLAGLEEFKAKKAKELYNLKRKEFAPGNFEKNDKYLQQQYPELSDRERLKILQKKPSSFIEQFIELANDVGYKSDDVFKDSARLYYGTGYKQDVDVPSVVSPDKSTELDDGIYSDAKNKIIFQVKDKVVISSQNY